MQMSHFSFVFFFNFWQEIMNAICDEDDIKAISFADSDKVNIFPLSFTSYLVALGGTLTLVPM